MSGGAASAVDAVTARWAEALFGLARRKDALEAVRADVRRIATEVAVPAVAEFLFHPRVGREEKRRKLGALLASFHPLTQNFVQLLLDRRREGVLRRLGAAFRRLDLRAKGEVEGVVESTRPLGPADLEALATALGARLSKKVILESRVVPELVGGVRVLVDDRMIDYSVQGRLGELRKRLLEAPLPT